MITKHTYDFPYPEAVPTTLEDVKTYTDTLAAFFAEKMGLVVRTDLSVMTPDYASNTYMTFLAKDATSAPCLAVYRTNSTYASSDLMWKCYAISPVTKVNETYRPITVFASYSNDELKIYKYQSSIAFNIANLGTTYRFSLVCIDFNDGRKLFCTRSTNVSTGNIVSRADDAAIYFAPIIMDGHKVNACLVCAAGINSSWFENEERRACNTEQTETPLYQNLHLTPTSVAGMVFSSSQGKEWMHKADLYIGTDAYMPDVIHYSDYAKAIYKGSVFSVNNKKYVCICIKDTYSSTLIVPEEVE